MWWIASKNFSLASALSLLRQMSFFLKNNNIFCSVRVLICHHGGRDEMMMSRKKRIEERNKFLRACARIFLDGLTRSWFPFKGQVYIHLCEVPHHRGLWRLTDAFHLYTSPLVINLDPMWFRPLSVITMGLILTSQAPAYSSTTSSSILPLIPPEISSN